MQKKVWPRHYCLILSRKLVLGSKTLLSFQSRCVFRSVWKLLIHGVNCNHASRSWWMQLLLGLIDRLNENWCHLLGSSQKQNPIWILIGILSLFAHDNLILGWPNCSLSVGGCEERTNWIVCLFVLVVWLSSSRCPIGHFILTHQDLTNGWQILLWTQHDLFCWAEVKNSVSRDGKPTDSWPGANLQNSKGSYRITSERRN